MLPELAAACLWQGHNEKLNLVSEQPRDSPDGLTEEAVRKSHS